MLFFNDQDDGWNNPWGGNQKEQRSNNVFSFLNKVNDFFAKGPKNNKFFQNKRIIVVVVIFVLWMSSGIYRVEPDEQGVVTRFGAWVYNVAPGLHYHWPSPIEAVYTPKVTVVHRIDSGLLSEERYLDNTPIPEERTAVSSKRSRKIELTRNIQTQVQDSYMLTTDQNILDVKFAVFWSIKEPKAFLFNTRSPENTVKIAADSAIREIIAQSTISSALTDGRATINHKAQTLLQDILDQYGTGIMVVQVELQGVNPPEAVISAFRDVQSANADKERMQNEALVYSNGVIPEARGRATQILQEAEAEKIQVIYKAEGDATRFMTVKKEFDNAKEITLNRIYIETIEKILKNKNVFVIDQTIGKNGVLPFLDLKPKTVENKE